MRRLVEGTFATMLSKKVVLVVNAISIPIPVRYFATESSCARGYDSNWAINAPDSRPRYRDYYVNPWIGF
jgi:hypothetical protein